jgi:hypothetical protein
LKRFIKRNKYKLVSILFILIVFNIKFISGVNLKNQPKTKSIIIKQLNYLEYELKNDNLGVRMQSVFPEGFVFINALYGLTWCELAINYNLDTDLNEKAFEEAKFAYNQIDSEYGKAIFDNEMQLEYGAFYTGWKNYLLSKILSFHSTSSQDSLQFINTCNAISSAINENESPFLESYPGASWPADIFLGIASLKIHDNIIESKYESTIETWVSKVKLHLDPYTGLVPHSVDAFSGEVVEGARGCSISLIVRLLLEIDYNFAYEQFEIYKKYFSISRLGVPAIREYPKGKEGRGDIDSGPVILKVGFAGTIVSIGVFKSFGEFKTANKTSKAMESFGMSYSIKKRKRYVFGMLPIADAFIAWSRVSPVVNEKIENELLPPKSSNVN